MNLERIRLKYHRVLVAAESYDVLAELNLKLDQFNFNKEDSVRLLNSPTKNRAIKAFPLEDFF